MTSHQAHLVEEVPLAISINGINFAVMLASPFDIEDFVVGYLHSESVIKHNRDIHDINITAYQDALIVDVVIANRCLKQLKARQRQLKGTSGCGLCGSQSLELAFPELVLLPRSKIFDLSLAATLKPQLRQWQTHGANSGALHAAFWLNEKGNIQVCREDIGRHNALDKIIGHVKRRQINTANGAALVTSRCSVELVQKAILAQIPNLLSLASPSTLAVKLARQSNLNLIHIPRHDKPYVLSGEN